MNLFLRLCLITTLLGAASGCVYVDGKNVDLSDWEETQRDNRELIAQLDIGMQRSAVIRQLGTPSDSEAFNRDGEEVRVLFYRTQRKHADGETSRDETTPLVFKNDILIGWGNAVYNDLQR